MKHNAQVFLCYSRSDADRIEELYEKISQTQYKPWMDKKDILPGQKWKIRIESAIKESDFFLAFLSESAFEKRGVLQREINIALDMMNERLQRDIFIIPVKLEKCKIPQSLSDFQYVNLYEKDGWDRLLQAMAYQMERLKDLKKKYTSNKYEVLKRKAYKKEKSKQAIIKISRGDILQKSAATSTKNKATEKLTLKNIAVYQNLSELLYRTRNKARDIVNEIIQNSKPNTEDVNILLENKNRLVNIMYKEKLSLDASGAFNVVHSYKNILVSLNAVINELKTKPVFSNSELKNMYQNLDAAYIASSNAIRDVSMIHRNLEIDGLWLEILELYRNISEYVYRIKHKAQDILNDMGKKGKEYPDNMNKFTEYIGELQEYMYKGKYWLEVLESFVALHSYKELLTEFQSKIAQSNKRTKSNLDKLKSIYTKIEKKYKDVNSKLSEVYAIN